MKSFLLGYIMLVLISLGFSSSSQKQLEEYWSQILATWLMDGGEAPAVPFDGLLTDAQPSHGSQFPPKIRGRPKFLKDM